MSGRALRAEPVDWSEAWPLVAHFDAVDGGAGLPGSAPWLSAAAAVRGEAALRPIALRGADGGPVGVLVLEEGTARWTSGSPGKPTLRWPFAALGFGFRPRWTPSAADVVRSEWVRCLRARFPEHRLELAGCCAQAWERARLELQGPVVRMTPGRRHWRAAGAVDAAELERGLTGRRRRRVAYYRRRIARHGGRWHELEPARVGDVLARCDVWWPTAGGESRDDARAFLSALGRELGGRGLHLSALRLGAGWAAVCMGVVFGGCYHAVLEEHGPSDLDLGRQGVLHQLRIAADAGGVERVDLGGEHGAGAPLRRWLGARPIQTWDLVATAGFGGALRQDVVDGVLQAYRGARRALRGTGRTASRSVNQEQG